MSDFWSIQKGPITKDSLAFLRGALSLEDWNARCRTIKRINGGVYPPDWYSAIVASGFAEEVLAKFGETSHLKVEDKVDFSALNSTSVADAMLAIYESEKDTSTVITVRGQGREMRVVLEHEETLEENGETCLLYTSPSPRD